MRETYLFVLLWEKHHAGGVNLVVRNLAKKMDAEGRLRPLVAINDWNAKKPRYSSDQVALRFTLADRYSFATLVKLIVTLPLRLLVLRRFLQSENVRVVNFHYFSSAALGVALLKLVGLYRGKLVLSFHGTDIKRPSGWMEANVFRFILRQASTLVACSKGLAERLIEDLQVERRRVHVIYNGVDHAVFHPGALPSTGAVAEIKTPCIVSIGSYIPRKNQKCLLEAFYILADRRPDLYLYFAGAEGPDLQALRESVDARGLADRVRMLVSLGPLDVAYLLTRATVCVQPARAEGLPLAVLEAAAVGVPLALSNIPGHDEIVSDGVDGMLFDPDDPKQCAEAVAELLSDRVRAVGMAAIQRATAVGRFSWDACLEGYMRAVLN